MIPIVPEPPATLENGIPKLIVHLIALNFCNFHDMLNFSLVNKSCYNTILNDSSLWIRYLKIIGSWEATDNSPNNVDFSSISAIDCLSHPISDPNLAREYFIRIYTIMNPPVNEMLLKNYANFQNSPILREFDSPSLQAKLFSNMVKFLLLYKVERSAKYHSLVIRLDTILDLFVGTIIREIGIKLDKKQYVEVKSLIDALSQLEIDDPEIGVDPLNSLLEFFIARYSETYSKVTDDSIVSEIFVKSTDKSNQGIVHGFKLQFSRLDMLFSGDMASILNEEMLEVGSIFKQVGDSDNISEVPIILKLIETFLNSYLISGLIDKIMIKAREIDQIEEEVGTEKKQLEQLINGDSGASKEAVNESGSTVTPISSDDDSPINIMNANSLFFQCVPYIHYKLISTLQNLQFPETMVEHIKMDYIKVTCEFVNFYYDPYLLEFLEKLPKQCHDSLVRMVDMWESIKIDDKKNMETDILRMVDDSHEHKKIGPFDIFSTFTNIFKFNNGSSNKSSTKHTKVETENERKITKISANLQILLSNVEGIKSLISVDLTVLVLQHVKNSYDLLLGLTKYSTTEDLNKQLYQTCSDIFTDMMKVLLSRHIEPGFTEALNTLRNYKPSDFQDRLKATSVAVAPLNNFIELVNVGDLILQMVGVFYQRELVFSGIVKAKKGKYKDFLSMSDCEKSITKFESILDTYMADGLDISINVIISEVNYTILRCGVNDSTYNMKSMEELAKNQDKASEWILKSVEILDTHFMLLEKSIDKSILDVFRQEIGERLIAIFIKLLTKRFVISVMGAIQFITDVNYLYDFFVKYRVKPTVQYFISFKQISQLYLIDCSEDRKQCKELGRLVVELGRENGVFSPEEVYQFVTRRADWAKIKKAVDKIMYGFSSDDCIIM
ncbi:hypothetical protein FOA43_004707 [Brettanomyces nanus]|uniref:Exocyst complex component Sec10-like alpha-helical bundle domain-containing protein n=1 Tax=Eeniella nana TaxID=13502 RepID=A0A875SCZ9_EENNA|nr:uncharacterized protein FOA43_004707 [Brettanomyces nanus]QPG77299.1 hypothetical protein FOA43_004707 [Brettanomyces nanus]